MSRKILSLEIREGSIAAVLLDSGFKGSQLEAQGYFPIPADKAGKEGIKEALETIVETLNPTGATCVLGIPRPLFLSEIFPFPFMTSRKSGRSSPLSWSPPYRFR